MLLAYATIEHKVSIQIVRHETVEKGRRDVSDHKFALRGCGAEVLRLRRVGGSNPGRCLKTIGICYGIGHISPMNAYRHVKLFKNGRNQAVRIPREYELPGEDAIMRRDGDKLIIEPAPASSLLAVLAKLTPIEESFPAIGDPAPGPVDL